jgi:hypothetical protein
MKADTDEIIDFPDDSGDKFTYTGDGWYNFVYVNMKLLGIL